MLAVSSNSFGRYENDKMNRNQNPVDILFGEWIDRKSIAQQFLIFNICMYFTSQTQWKAKFFDFLNENRRNERNFRQQKCNASNRAKSLSTFGIVSVTSAHCSRSFGRSYFCYIIQNYFTNNKTSQRSDGKQKILFFWKVH